MIERPRMAEPPPRCAFNYSYKTPWPTSLHDAFFADRKAGEKTDSCCKTGSTHLFFTGPSQPFVPPCGDFFFFFFVLFCRNGRCSRRGSREGESHRCEHKSSNTGEVTPNSSRVVPLPAIIMSFKGRWMNQHCVRVPQKKSTVRSLLPNLYWIQHRVKFLENAPHKIWNKNSLGPQNGTEGGGKKT